MMVHLDVRNQSSVKRLYRKDVLVRLAEHVCAAEGLGDGVELSLLLCDDAFIAELNRTYRGKNGPTDVLAFAQEAETFHGARLLGDIVISLETVERFCEGGRARMREEVKLLFCHGLLHLLGYDHGSPGEEAEMIRRQALYLDRELEAAWHRYPQDKRSRGTRTRGGA